MFHDGWLFLLFLRNLFDNKPALMFFFYNRKTQQQKSASLAVDSIYSLSANSIASR